MKIKCFEWILLKVCLFLLVPVFGQKEYVKTIIRSYPAEKGMTVKVSNSSGNINIFSKKHPEIKIEVRISVISSNENESNSFLDQIQVNFKQEKKFIFSNVVINQEKKFWWLNQAFSDQEYKVDYYIFLPQSTNIILEGNHGKITIDSLSGGSEITMRYGKIEIGKLKSPSKLFLVAGSGDFGQLDRAYASITNSNLKIGFVKKLDLESDKSDVVISKADTIKCNSKYCDFSIEKSSVFNFKGSFDKLLLGACNRFDGIFQSGKVFLKNLEGSGNFYLNKSTLEIDHVNTKFKSIFVEGESSIFSCKLQPNSNFSYKIRTQDANCFLPTELLKVYELKDNPNFKVEGNYPRKLENQSEFLVYLENGGLNLTWVR